jgi:4-amino-4-deoxy-L-arabinose transferase-like glycosyltransferase
MNAVFKHFRKNIIYLIIFLFILAKLLTIPYYKLIWWDSAVYIGMGKYIYSFSNAGLWESSRPIVWPLILGFFWKIGFDIVLWGRITEIVFGSLCILLTYLIGSKLFNQKIALLASIFLALSPTFFFFNGIMLTEIVSTFFSLVAIYFFIGKKHFASGVFFGIAFMTRYLQLFVLFAVIISILVFNKKNIEYIRRIIIGFVVAIMPFLILNQILYNNALFPFVQQIFLSKNSGWFNYHPLSYYFIELFKENFLYLLSIFGFILIFRNKNINKMVIGSIFIIFFIFFNLIKQKEMRFLIILFPYMYLLISFAVFYLFDFFSNIRNLLYTIVIISVLSSFITTSNYYKSESGKINEYITFQAIFENIGSDAKIWISHYVLPYIW